MRDSVRTYKRINECIYDFIGVAFACFYMCAYVIEDMCGVCVYVCDVRACLYACVCVCVSV